MNVFSEGVMYYRQNFIHFSGVQFIAEEVCVQWWCEDLSCPRDGIILLPFFFQCLPVLNFKIGIISCILSTLKNNEKILMHTNIPLGVLIVFMRILKCKKNPTA